ncbi:MAG TPA: Trk system potassium transporter TrkA [Deltaproteobacteria bacterium]|nr:Trk system potassium transporter TrkA [Deltaproteobacteria bacterium]
MKIIIIGAGEVGYHIAHRLSLENKDVVVIDTDDEAVRRVSENIDVQAICGSGSSPSILEEAGIKEAEILLAVTDSDETNLIACLMTDLLSSSTKKLARIRNADFDAYHEVFKDSAPRIDTIINPEIEVVRSIEQYMSVPGAGDVGEFENGRVKFVGIRLKPDTPVVGLRLSEISKAIGRPFPLIAAILRGEEMIIPKGDERLLEGDMVYFISETDNLMETLKLFDQQSEPVRRVLIVGGGRIGFRLAERLEEDSVYTKIIEKDENRCSFLAEKLNRAVILHGDGTDQVILEQEGIRDMDVVVTLTFDEQTNVLASLLAKQLGARKTITRINSFRYLPLMATIGIEQVVSPRLSAINSILRHIRRGKVVSALSLKGEQAEVIEAVAMETSEIVGKPLKEISFPKGVLVTVIIRGDRITIPSGDSVIQPGDRVIIFGSRQAVPQIEKILAVKLEYF